MDSMFYLEYSENDLQIFIKNNGQIYYGQMGIYRWNDRQSDGMMDISTIYGQIDGYKYD